MSGTASDERIPVPPEPPGAATRSCLSPRVARSTLVAYALLTAVVLLQPTPTVASGGVARIGDVLSGLGAPAFVVAPTRVEALVNAGLFMPLVALALLSLPRLSWTAAVTASFAASLGVELVQGLFLPQRSSQPIDVVANTSGALAGALLVLAFRRSSARRATTHS